MINIINKKNIVIFIVVVGLTLLFWSSVMLQDIFEKSANFLQNYGSVNPVLSVLFFVGLSVISSMLVSFSSVFLVPVAIVIWSKSLTVLFLLLGWLIGAVFSYLIGRYGGYPIVKKFVSIKQIDYYRNIVINKVSFWAIFLFRLILPAEIPGYVLGIIKYPFVKYFLITFLAEIPYAIYTVYAIDSIINKKPIVFAFAAVFWVIAVWFLTYFYRKRIKE